jgi:ABC-type protease/lipase transport system fused ATPase/permease subunit
MTTRPPGLGRRLLEMLGPGLALGLALSVGVSLLQLAVPLYSLQVFDRVLSSGHLETLLLLSLMAAVALLAMGLLDALKAALLQRLATRVGDRLGREVLAAAASAGGGSAGLGLRELETVRAVLAGPATAALFELPWLPLAVAVTWLLHPTLGAFTAAAVLFLLLLGGINHALTRPRVRRAHELGLEAQTRGEAVSRHGDVVRAMGLLPALEARFAEVQSRALLLQQRAGEHGGWLNGLVRATRLAVQAAAMGLGAWLVVADEMTPGALIAGTILVSRALAPVEQALFGWRGLVQLRDSLGRLESLLARGARRGPAPMPLPAPRGRLELEGVGMATPEGRALLRDVSLALPAGTALAVVGPSAAGKTTLCRLIAGCVAPSRGRLRLDGADYATSPRSSAARTWATCPRSRRSSRARSRPTSPAWCRGPIRSAWSTRRGWRGCTRWSWACPGATTRCSARAGCRSRAGSGSGWRWPAPSTAARGWSSWTSRTRTWTRPARRPWWTRSRRSRPAAPRP